MTTGTIATPAVSARSVGPGLARTQNQMPLQRTLTTTPHGDHNEGMTSQKNTKPFQFGLRSIFLVTSAIAVAFGVLKWLGPKEFLMAVFLTTPIQAAVAILLKGKGGWYSAWAWFLLLVVVEFIGLVYLLRFRPFAFL